MKRIVKYTTEDGRTFDSRVTARQHEINEQRRKRVRACVERVLKAADDKPISLTDIVDVLCNHASEFADALSARAAVRAARESQVRKPRAS